MGRFALLFRERWKYRRNGMASTTIQPYAENTMSASDGSRSMDQRWAVVLAGGSGTRLQSLTNKFFGENRPKQFCRLFGGDTLLGHTRARIAPLVCPKHTAYVVVEAHARYYNQQLFDTAPERIFVQPFDRGTTAAIAFSLARIAAADPDAIVGFFPADHYFADEPAFIRHMNWAYEMAGLCRAALLVGVQPEHPEVEYGWIEPGACIARSDSESAFRVRRFWEKPALNVARELIERGCLWNTFIMVGRVSVLRSMLEDAAPEAFRAFEPVRHGAGDSVGAVNRAFDNIQSGDFSKRVLSALPERLAVLRLDGSGWSDLGTPERLSAACERYGMEPLTAAYSATSS